MSFNDRIDVDQERLHLEHLKEICKDIGCSGVDPDMCQNRPQDCSIIRKVIDTIHEEGR